MTGKVCQRENNQTSPREAAHVMHSTEDVVVSDVSPRPINI